MLLENIPLGKSIEIFVDREDYRYRLTSKVEDTNEFRVCVTAISARGRFFQFQKEDRIRLVYRDEEVMWEWDHVKAGLAKLDGSPVHYLQIRDRGRSFNRRGAYRIKLLEYVDVQYYRVPGKPGLFADVPEGLPEVSVDDMDHMSEEKKEMLMELWTPKVEHCMIKDISESGIGIYTDKEFRTGDEFYLEVPSSYGSLPIRAAVVRKTEISSPTSNYRFLFGCELTKADQRLIRYIYEIQRERLKKQKESKLQQQEKREEYERLKKERLEEEKKQEEDDE